MWCSAAETHLKLLDRVISGASFSNWWCVWVWHCTSSICMWQYYVRCTRSGVNRCTLLTVPYLGHMCYCRLDSVLWSHIGTPMRLLAEKPSSTAGCLFLCQYRCGTILVTQYLRVCNWLVSRAGALPFKRREPWCSLLFCLLLFSLSLLSFCGLLLSGWGLRTDRVLIDLSQSCIANL